MKASRKIDWQQLKDYLDDRVDRFNKPDFIADDPVQIPHEYKQKQDIEIAGLFAAVLAWGQRKTIVRKCRELMSMMGNEPYKFIVHHSEKDLRSLLKFKHRTFNSTDTLYFIEALKTIYSRYKSLESAFFTSEQDVNVEKGLIQFHDLFFSLEHYPHRTKKHLPTPVRKSTCKRINMYLRWMVRNDGCGVDFGIWQKIRPAQLICPCDVHVDRIGRRLKLIRRKQTDWLTALELTENLKKLDPDDPVKYDFALFGIGIEENLHKSSRRS